MHTLSSHLYLPFPFSCLMHQNREALVAGDQPNLPQKEGLEKTEALTLLPASLLCRFIMIRALSYEPLW